MVAEDHINNRSNVRKEVKKTIITRPYCEADKVSFLAS